jgi:hypothetical protein
MHLQLARCGRRIAITKAIFTLSQESRPCSEN